jgi:5-dehydro-2-deoxygluconokinase
VGGSSANVAVGLARLGARASMLTRVGDEQMGTFVREALATAGVDVTHVRTAPGRLTGLVVLGIAARDQYPHIFFRENCADMALDATDVDESHIASSRLLAITGTHLSTPTTAAAVHHAVGYARRHGTRVVLDVDYRPVLWGLAAAGDGANRYVASSVVTAAVAELLPSCDLVVGTEEEIRIAGGAADTDVAVANIRAAGQATIVVKRGAAGCTVLPHVGPPVDVQGFPVEVFNTLGAGDAFLAGFLHALLQDGDWNTCARIGNACGALAVSRHGCAPALPSAIELSEFLARDVAPRQPDRDSRLHHLHVATTTRRPRSDLYVLAFDHRRQLEQLAASCGLPADRIRVFKSLVADAVDRIADSLPEADRLGVIVDDRYGADVLARMSLAGRWVGRAIEVPGSRPVEFESHESCGLQLLGWPAKHVVKCLVFYHPDDALPLRLAQERRIVGLWRDTVRLERELLLEVIVTNCGHPVDDTTVARSMQRFYNLGVRPAWWKLEPPTSEAWPRIVGAIEANDPHCNGVLLLGLDASEQVLGASFAVAAPVRQCRGFAVGRSIFGAAARDWMRHAIDDAAVVDDIANRYRRLIDLWRSRRP